MLSVQSIFLIFFYFFKVGASNAIPSGLPFKSQGALRPYKQEKHKLVYHRIMKVHDSLPSRPYFYEYHQACATDYLTWANDAEELVVGVMILGHL